MESAGLVLDALGRVRQMVRDAIEYLLGLVKYGGWFPGTEKPSGG